MKINQLGRKYNILAQESLWMSDPLLNLPFTLNPTWQRDSNFRRCILSALVHISKSQTGRSSPSPLIPTLNTRRVQRDPYRHPTGRLGAVLQCAHGLIRPAPPSNLIYSIVRYPSNLLTLIR